MSEIKYFKLNEDDILEIVSEYIAEKTGISEFTTKSIMFGSPTKDLRMIIAVGSSSLSHINLTEVDKNIEFNGEHTSIEGLTDNEMMLSLDKMISTGDF